MSTIKLHRFPLSGHSHRVELLLSLLGLEAEIISVDLAAGAHKSPAFLKMNSLGQVPVLEDGAITLSDSNAIITYLACRYDGARRWLPVDGLAAAQVQRYLSMAAGLLAYGPATARLANVFGASVDKVKAIATAHSLLSVLDGELDGRDWLVGEQPTLADVAHYTYIAHAPEGDVALDDYPHIRAWLQRIENLPGFIPMQASAVGLAA
ncbi:glutathione S-transferase [Gammaproteobacteria bacterium 53_120_T64]|nr:glutathione S-transferase [Gammaproteobacteria bacterium 53_120_T64]